MGNVDDLEKALNRRGMNKAVSEMIARRLLTPILGPTALAMEYISKLEAMGIKQLPIPTWALIEEAFVEGYNTGFAAKDS